MNEKVESGLEVVARFLLGEGALEGRYFMDKHPGGKYWWRAHLRAALAEVDSLKLAAKVSAQDANEAERALQLKHEAHRKTWRQLEQVTGLLREMRDAMNRYEADCDEYPPFHHNQMMDRVGAALSATPSPAMDAKEE